MSNRVVGLSKLFVGAESTSGIIVESELSGTWLPSDISIPDIDGGNKSEHRSGPTGFLVWIWKQAYIMRRGFLKYIGKRLLRIFITLYIVATILFVLFRLVPGDPIVTVLSPGMTQENVAHLESLFGLDEPLWRQYVIYIVNMFTFDFGMSFQALQPVWDIIQYRLVNTLYLMVVSITITYLVAYYLGVLLAWNRNTKKDTAGMIGAVMGAGIPPFITGLVFIMVFSLSLGIFPIGGKGVATQDVNPLVVITDLEFWHHLALPVITNSLFFLATPILLMRNNTVLQLNKDYITYLHSKGISKHRIMYRHAARNALLPFTTHFAITFGYMIGGQVLVETVFSWPGMGLALVEAIHANDYPVTQGVFFLIAMVVMFANFAVDLLYYYLDPRIKTGAEEA